MEKRKQWISILIVAMTLATAWAIRGQFGHEQGAAWAGGIGALALVLVANRKDWYNKMLTIAFASAVGWGAGGMISYGVVVGYGNGSGFGNVWYGFAMLFVIGGLFGLLGGGLVGLTLDSTEKRKVDWGKLFAEMVAGGIVGYYLLIEQFGWKMTPPRSEAWSICFGAGIAMLWYMARNKHTAPLRVAFYSTIGAGFGFAFGNFLQVVLSNNAGFSFNWWNVMEYSIGFFGAIGMAYGVFSSKWPEESAAPTRWQNRFALLFIVILIPLVIFEENFFISTLTKRFGDIPNVNSVAWISSIVGTSAMVIVAIVGLIKFNKKNVSFERKDVLLLFVIYFATYILISYIITKVFAGVFLSNHYLYIVNFVVVLILLKKLYPAFLENRIDEVNIKRWGFYLLGLIVIFAILALIAINSHGEIGHHTRFPIK
jgi:hypothetical protein